eukprot:159536-Amphidinium_carterae.1
MAHNMHHALYRQRVYAIYNCALLHGQCYNALAQDTINDNEDKQQTLRLCSVTEDVTIGMMKMNII